MRSNSWDVVIVGGGLAGSSLALSLVQHGVRVLILERETVFRDRVRGEGMSSWGTAEARTLGLDAIIRATCGRELPWIVYQDASDRDAAPRHRDLMTTTPSQAGFLAFAYPELQQVLLVHAEASGAEVWRGAVVTSVSPGHPPTVQVQHGSQEVELKSQLVVGADGRNSRMRSWAGFQMYRDPDRLVIASTLMRGGKVQRDAVTKIRNPPVGQAVLVVPLGDDRFRLYLMYRKQGERKHLSGPRQVEAFVHACLACGAPADWFTGAESAGPLAEFEGASAWVEHPYRGGIALVGDAAGASDPSFGNGLSLTLRDVRVLRDNLLGQEDREAAGHAYAAEHDHYFGALRRLEGWFTDLLHEVGPEADTRRARVFPVLDAEPDRLPDIVGLGPDAPSDETARRRLFVEA